MHSEEIRWILAFWAESCKPSRTANNSSYWAEKGALAKARDKFSRFYASFRTIPAASSRKDSLTSKLSLFYLTNVKPNAELIKFCRGLEATGQMPKKTQDLRELLGPMDDYVIAPKEREWIDTPLPAVQNRRPTDVISGGKLRELIVECLPNVLEIHNASDFDGKDTTDSYANAASIEFDLSICSTMEMGLTLAPRQRLWQTKLNAGVHRGGSDEPREGP